MVQYAVRATLPSRPRRLPCRPTVAGGLPRPGLAHSRPARRRAGRHPLHRPDQPVHDPGRTDFAAGRRHRRRQRRARLARRAGAHHRHPALPGRLVAAGVRRLPDPGAGARGLRRRRSALLPARWLPIALAAWLKDVLPVPPVLGLYPGPLALAAGYGLLTALRVLALAARPRGAHPGRGPVPRRADARARPPVPSADRWPMPSSRRRWSALTVATAPIAASRCGSAPPPSRRWSCSVSAAVCVMLAARAGVPLGKRHPGAARPRQPAPAGRGDAADAGLRRARPVDPGRRRADPGQRAARGRRTTAGQRAELLLRRHPERPVAAVRGAGAGAAGRRGDARRCPACAPASSR